jgi:3-deoxy-7-phosphoheptulonate synthase
MLKSNNINIAAIDELPSPAEIRAELPLTAETLQKVVSAREEITRIMDRKSDRKIMIVGPCSIHDIDSAMEYAKRLKQLSEEVSDKLLLVMRVYFEKPRTTLGWKGLVYDPELNGSYNIEKGLRIGRKLLLDIVNLGLPTATEMLEPVVPQYIADVVSWAAIGARTTESQTHRQMASGLSMPIGFKNATDGSVQVAIDAINTALSPHSFIGVTDKGKSAVFRTTGNKYGHLVLRGGQTTPNYGAEHIAFSKVAMQKNGLSPNIIVDCSHANSFKDPAKQRNVVFDVTEQLRQGEDSVIGMMLESNILPGSQKVEPGKELQSGLSITDSCIGWDETCELIRYIHQELSR